MSDSKAETSQAVVPDNHRNGKPESPADLSGSKVPAKDSLEGTNTMPPPPRRQMRPPPPRFNDNKGSLSTSPATQATPGDQAQPVNAENEEGGSHSSASMQDGSSVACAFKSPAPMQADRSPAGSGPDSQTGKTNAAQLRTSEGAHDMWRALLTYLFLYSCPITAINMHTMSCTS